MRDGVPEDDDRSDASSTDTIENGSLSLGPAMAGLGPFHFAARFVDEPAPRMLFDDASGNEERPISQ